MPKKIHESLEYKKLSNKYAVALKNFKEKVEVLRKDFFKNLEREKRILEVPLEREFSILWEKSFSQKYKLNKFRFDFDLIKNGHNYLLIMGLTTPKGNFDLESIAKSHPLKERKHEILNQIDTNYSLTVKKIYKDLEFLGFQDYNVPKILKDFLKFYNILIPRVEYFSLPN